MKKVLLFGATGNVGKEIARELKQQGYDTTVVVRNKSKLDTLSGTIDKFFIADITDKNSLTNICKGFDIVISALGKSVSPNDNSKPTFYEIDFVGNSNVLEEALKSNVQKFVYISAFHAEKYLHLDYFKVHHDFSEKLKSSGLNYSIIKPPAIFCAFIDVIDMAKKGQLMNLGKGDKKTNPIYEGDLAKVCVDSIHDKNITIEAGGKEIYTRKQINEIILREIHPDKKLRNIPMAMFTFSLSIIKLFSKNAYDKFAFYTEVMQHDTIAPLVEQTSLKDYVKWKLTQI